MKNSTFRIIVASIIVVGLLFLNGSFSSSKEESKEEEVSTSAVEEASEESPETSKIAGTDNVVKEVVSAVIETDIDSNEIQEDTMAQENIVTEVPVVEQKTLEGEEVLMLIADSVVTSTDGYKERFGKDTLNVFTEDVENSFAFNMAVSYNLWGGNVQSAVYSLKRLQEHGTTLSLELGMETGGKGTADVQIYLDDAELPAYEYAVEAAAPPQSITLEIGDAKTMTILVTNYASVTNRIVFYNLKLS